MTGILMNMISGNKRQAPLMRCNEYWIRVRDVRNYEDVNPMYWISSHGRVYSEYSGYLTATDSFGYAYIQMRGCSGKGYRVRIHRLVLMAFNYIDGCEALEVNHRDGNKSNNILDNLEWCTRVENMNHAVSSGLANSCESSYRATITNEQANEICKLLTTGEYSPLDISNMLNISRDIVAHILHRNAWTQISKNYIFKRKVSRTFTNSELEILLDFVKNNDIASYNTRVDFYIDMLNSIGSNLSHGSCRDILENIIENPTEYYNKLSNCSC